MVTYVRSKWLHMSDLNGYIYVRSEWLHVTEVNGYICQILMVTHARSE